jgi:hypothetical protein
VYLWNKEDTFIQVWKFDTQMVLIGIYNRGAFGDHCLPVDLVSNRLFLDRVVGDLIHLADLETI